MNYRILIIDDEPSIAEGICFLVQRLLPECEVAGVAYDGIEGFEKVCTVKPDIVLTDIRMPECDGLGMIQRLRHENTPSKFIILSGFEEFEYAKTAIKLDVEAYITKPVDEKELVSVITKVCQSIESERNKNEKAQEISQTVRSYALKEFLTNTEMSDVTSREQLKKLGIPLYYNHYLCVLFEVESGNDTDSPLFFETFSESVEAVFQKIEDKLTVEYREQIALLIIASQNPIKHIHEMLESIRMRLVRQLNVTVTVGVGREVKKAIEIRNSFDEAICSLNYKLIKGLNCVISYEQICSFSMQPNLISEEDIKKFETFIDRMDEEGYKQVIEDIFKKVELNKNVNLEELQRLSLNLILSGMRNMSFMQIQLNEFIGKNIFSLESIEKFRTTTQLKNWIFNMLNSMNQLMLKNNIPQKKDVIEEAKLYIMKNFDKNISLNEIATMFYINPYYFSHLFKKKTGENYQHFLTELRVSRAKKLLEETDLKIYEVCDLVGYSDINNFNRVFERTVGMKPSEYKKSI